MNFKVFIVQQWHRWLVFVSHHLHIVRFVLFFYGRGANSDSNTFLKFRPVVSVICSCSGLKHGGCRSGNTHKLVN